MILIDKEFLSFGHQFALRNGISQRDSHNEDQRSPIFLQWLDIIQQLIHQFPEAFEFNMEFLLYLAFHYNSCLYGTFMYNCESERFEKKAKSKTTSVWTDMLRNINKYINNRYAPIEVIIPNSSPYKMRFWEEFFFKFNTSIERNIGFGVKNNNSVFGNSSSSVLFKSGVSKNENETNSIGNKNDIFDIKNRTAGIKQIDDDEEEREKSIMKEKQNTYKDNHDEFQNKL